MVVDAGGLDVTCDGEKGTGGKGEGEIDSENNDSGSSEGGDGENDSSSGKTGGNSGSVGQGKVASVVEMTTGSSTRTEIGVGSVEIFFSNLAFRKRSSERIGILAFVPIAEFGDEVEFLNTVDLKGLYFG